jgi:4-hydroxyphenylpyruvate dioxygenase
MHFMDTMLASSKPVATNNDFLPLQGTDYVEFYVGNAKQAAHFYKTAFGFQSLAYAGPETGVKDKASYAVRQNKLTFVFTTALRSGNAMADHIYKHGDAVKVLALRVDDATDAWHQTTVRGARSYMEPQTLRDDEGEVVLSGIHTYGENGSCVCRKKELQGRIYAGLQGMENKLQSFFYRIVIC